MQSERGGRVVCRTLFQSLVLAEEVVQVVAKGLVATDVRYCNKHSAARCIREKTEREIERRESGREIMERSYFARQSYSTQTLPSR